MLYCIHFENKYVMLYKIISLNYILTYIDKNLFNTLLFSIRFCAKSEKTPKFNTDNV